MKIALAHDSFTQAGGAERVLEALHELYPDAPVFTLVFDPKFKEQYKTWDIRTSRIQALFLSLGKLQYCLPLIPYGIDSLDFEGFDLIISSSSGFIKNLRKPKNAIHINYCHTPTRFLWSESASYIKQEVKWFLRPVVGLTLSRMKKWDYQGAQRVTKFISNSEEVQKRIQEYYKRDSEVIYPFVDTEFWKPTLPKKDYFLLAGRLQAHKNNELIIEIFNELGLPLHVIGSGRQEEYLKSIAKPNISFFGKVSDIELRDQYSAALGYIYPQIEDFGLMPLEAAACGTATLAYGKGGALETILPGITGEFFDSYDKEKIKQISLNWKAEKYKADVLQQQADKFSKEKFEQNILNYISKLNENRV
jgi:glycosyltransferase involved in cell wall biosynthesis